MSAYSRRFSYVNYLSLKAYIYETELTYKINPHTGDAGDECVGVGTERDS